jgi:hypothetical protein
MLWEQKVQNIVMLTDFDESGARICAQYVPTTVGVIKRYGQFSLTLDYQEPASSHTIIRHLILVHGPSGQRRMICHFQYLGWQGTEPPDSARSFLEFRTSVVAATSVSTAPTVIHDATGVGQAAVFMLIDREIKRYQLQGVVDLFETVATLRKSRAYVILHDSHYTFAHKAIFEAVDLQPASGPGLTPEFAQFAHSLVVPSSHQGFDFGTNGRKFLRLGHFSLLQSMEGPRPEACDASLAVCNDILVIVRVLPNEGGYEMLTSPVDRSQLSAKDVQHSWDEPIFTITAGDRSWTLEADSDAVKREWVQYVNERLQLVQTAALRGPRMIALKPDSREELAMMLGLPDPNIPTNVEELKGEWAVIPKVIASKEYLEWVGVQSRRTLGYGEGYLSASDDIFKTMGTPTKANNRWQTPVEMPSHDEPTMPLSNADIFKVVSRSGQHRTSPQEKFVDESTVDDNGWGETNGALGEFAGRQQVVMNKAW